MIDLDDQAVVHEERGGGHAPAVAEGAEFLGQRPYPDRLALGVQASQIAGAEKNIDMAGIGRRRRHGHAAGREQALGNGGAKESGVPEQPPIGAVVAVNVQPVVEPAIGRAQVNAFAPHDRSADAGPLERYFPADVFRRRPPRRQALLGRDTPGVETAPPRPVSREAASHPRRETQGKTCNKQKPAAASVSLLPLLLCVFVSLWFIP